MRFFVFDSDVWQEIYDSIRKNKTRTIITIFGAFWGILLLVSLLGAAKGIENTFNSKFGDFATNSMFIWAGKTSKPFKGYQEGRKFNLITSDIEKIRNEIKGVRFVIPRNAINSQVNHGLKTGTFRIYGDYPLLGVVKKKKMTQGRFINQNDIEQKKKVCVISQSIYEQMYDKGEDALGTYISINGGNYLVVGIFKAEGFGGPNKIHIPFSTFKLVYNQGNKFRWMMVTVKPGYDIVQAESDVKLLLKNLHKIDPKDNRAIGGFNLGEEVRRVSNFLVGMQFLTWFIGIATLVAGVFAIGNILLITVKERTKEIGIRRAIGATPAKIKQQIVLESVFLTLLSGSLGIIAGGGVLMIIDKTKLLINPTVNIPIVLTAYVMLVVLGTLIGYIPSYIATVLKPIEALREE